MLDRALAKAPAERFASAGEMAMALQAAMAQSPATSGGPVTTGDPATGGTTVVAPAPATVRPAGVDNELRGTLERLLARHVGPIARYLVQNAANKCDTPEMLCASLAGLIEPPAEREAFRAAALHQLQGSTIRTAPAAPLPPAIAPEELARAQQELARFIGPLARVLSAAPPQWPPRPRICGSVCRCISTGTPTARRSSRAASHSRSAASRCLR